MTSPSPGLETPQVVALQCGTALVILWAFANAFVLAVAMTAAFSLWLEGLGLSLGPVSSVAGLCTFMASGGLILFLENLILALPPGVTPREVARCALAAPLWSVAPAMIGLGTYSMVGPRFDLGKLMLTAPEAAIPLTVLGGTFVFLLAYRLKWIDRDEPEPPGKAP